MKSTIIGLLLLLSAPCISFAAETFPVGVPIPVKDVLFCFNKEDAQKIADNKGDAPAILFFERKCALFHGIAVYVKEVYRKDDWAVWEIHSAGIPVFYEATDWQPRPNGIRI